MELDEVIEKLKLYIKVQFGSVSEYARRNNCSRQHVSAVINKRKLPTDAMLHDIGLKKKRKMVTEFVSNKF